MEAGRATPVGQIQQGAALIPPAGALGWLPPNEWATVKDFYGYSAVFNPLAALGTQSQNISIQSDTNFIILFATLVATDAAETTQLAFAPALCELRDASSGATLTQQPVHVESLFGTAAQPGIFAVPKVMKANSSLIVTLQNLENQARVYRINFFGFRSYPNSNVFNSR